MAMKCPQSMVKCVALKGPSWLEVGICQLLLQRWHHDHCKLMTTSTPHERSSGWRLEIRHSVLWEKPRRTGLQTVRCFQTKILWAQILAFFVPSETLMSWTNVWSRFSWRAPEQLFYFYWSLGHVPLPFLLSLFLLEYNKSQVVVRQEYSLTNNQTMLKQVTLSFHGLSSPSVNAPWQRAGKGNTEPHDAPVQPEEIRAVIAPFSLRLGSQMPEKEKREIVRHGQGIKRGQRIGPKNKVREECGDPRMKEQRKPRRVLECRNRKTRPYRSSLPHGVTISGFQVLLSRITCLPSYPIGRRYLAYSSPQPVYVPHPISKWPTRPLSHSLYLGYKSGLKKKKWSKDPCSMSVLPWAGPLF